MKIFLLTFCLGILIVETNAQSFDHPGTPEQRAEKMTLQMIDELQLDSLQLERVEQLNLKYAKIAQTEIVNKNLNIWSMYRQGMQLNKKKEKELKPLLYPEQWKQYEQLKSKTLFRIWEHLF